MSAPSPARAPSSHFQFPKGKKDKAHPLSFNRLPSHIYFRLGRRSHIISGIPKCIGTRKNPLLVHSYPESRFCAKSLNENRPTWSTRAKQRHSILVSLFSLHWLAWWLFPPKHFRNAVATYTSSSNGYSAKGPSSPNDKKPISETEELKAESKTECSLILLKSI